MRGDTHPRRSHQKVCLAVTFLISILCSASIGAETMGAVSLRVLQQQLKACDGGLSCPGHVLTLGGLTRVDGYVVDPDVGDVILYGLVEAAAPPLHVADLAVALRNAWLKYAQRIGLTVVYEYPGCSIDPDPQVLTRLKAVADHAFSATTREEINRRLQEWPIICESAQSVRIMGVPRDSRFAKVCVEADYYMKRLTDGTVSLDIPGFSSLTDLISWQILDEMHNGQPISVPSSMINRFEFVPGDYSYCQGQGIVEITRCPLKLVTEEEFLSANKEVIGTGRSNPYAEAFASGFTTHYDRISVARPIYRELSNLFRFVALAKAMSEGDDGLHAGLLDYLISDFPLPHLDADSTLPGISRIVELKAPEDAHPGYHGIHMWRPMCGGVSIRIDANRNRMTSDDLGDLAQLSITLRTERPNRHSLFWTFQRPPSRRREENLTTSSPASSGSDQPPVAEQPTKPVRRPVRRSPVSQIILDRRRADDREAVAAFSREENVVLLDLYVDQGTGASNLDLVDANGSVMEMDPETANTFRLLLESATATKYSLLSDKELLSWEDFCDRHLKVYINPPSRQLPNGQTITLRQPLIIRTNLAESGFASLERIPALAERFTLLASAPSVDEGDDIETSAATLADRINRVSTLSIDKMLFVISLPPDMDRETREQWQYAVAELRGLLGVNRVLFNPTREEFAQSMMNVAHHQVIFEFTHTADRGFLCTDDQTVDAQAIHKWGDLSHITLLYSALGTCELLRLTDLHTALRRQGVGVIAGTYYRLPVDVSLKRLTALTKLLRQGDGRLDFPFYYLTQILDWICRILSRQGLTISDATCLDHDSSIIDSIDATINMSCQPQASQLTSACDTVGMPLLSASYSACDKRSKSLHTDEIYGAEARLSISTRSYLPLMARRNRRSCEMSAPC